MGFEVLDGYVNKIKANEQKKRKVERSEQIVRGFVD